MSEQPIRDMRKLQTTQKTLQPMQQDKLPITVYFKEKGAKWLRKIAETLTPKITQEGSTRSATPSKYSYQSLSLVVPGPCSNVCKFCVSLTHTRMKGIIDILSEKGQRSYESRIAWATDQTDSMIITGEYGDPMDQIPFITKALAINKHIHRPFRRIEVQTAGVGATREKIEQLEKIGVTGFSFSLSSLDTTENATINGTKKTENIANIPEICEIVKEIGLNLRISLNLTSYFDKYFKEGPEQLLQKISNLGANQLTLRVLYKGDNETKQSKWIDEHPFNPQYLEQTKKYIRGNGKVTGILPAGFKIYSIHGMSIVIDDDSMDTERSFKDPSEASAQALKYAILRTNGKLYYDWTDPNSLIF